jgi:hypothetical protein
MWFSGLRGAVAFALAVTFLEQPAFSKSVKESIFGTSVLVILFTVLVMGGVMPYLLIYLGIGGEAAAPVHEGSHDRYASNKQVSVPQDQIDGITEAELTQPLFGWLYTLDVQYQWAKLDTFGHTFLMLPQKKLESKI